MEQDFLDYLLDVGTIRVLAELYDQPIRAEDIAEKSGMSTATVYRKLAILLKHKQIRMTGDLLETGRRIKLYHAKPFELHIVNGILTTDHPI